MPTLPPNPNLDAPSFWEIFVNARSIIMEKPKGLMAFLLVLEFIRLLVNLGAAKLMSPMAPIMATFSVMAQSDQEDALNFVAAAFSAPEGSQIIGLYLLGLAITVLLAPIIILSFARVALGLWDGYEPSPRDLGYAFRKIWPALRICFYVSLYLILLAFATMATLFPIGLLVGLSKDPIMSTMLGLVGLVISGYIFYTFFWPLCRRIVCLQFLPFFAFIDGKSRERPITKIYHRLDSFPSHLNQATGLTLLFVMVPAMILGYTLLVINPQGIFNLVLSGAFQIILDLLLLWPITAMAGFYRLAFYPPEDDPSPEPVKKEQIDLEKEDHLGEA
ncbi:MAG: hypothetical protein LBT86_00650 [Deltaproteobacteria bacterium]|nr:hypothetical protein [Deltaproteobacteria bacterium]